ncbi:RNA-binding S4 domain-containing protein [Aureisphaera sp. CAU 1614]|uniref:RNA-binding S4 domain-containing protein n=1 Tax=Halomarinibacterium sedimenti TaxID=2857106 RepID=A0A9X1FM89_9FLAO|nr:RNA-binding S4 domain-containing protein [Halomarinibacterium sedimenti]MBW2936479.1 RNA-binding S4 domain-containing protein [Halomarinibacterium sedimenti]
MRIDKYLWCTRYFKTRNIATQVCKKGAIKVNNEPVKPSREVYPGDTITVRKDQIHYTLEVIDIPENRVGAKLVNLYRVDTTPPEAFKNQELLKYSKEYYRKKGVGRPTKKDRRDLEDFTDTTED